jgi:hypothetical protein
MILGVLQFVFYGVSIWISLKAKPLGNMPYRWGVYVGMISAWMSLVLLASSVFGFMGGHLVGASALFVDGLLAALSSFGILRRRRFGAVALGFAYLLLILIAPHLAAMPDRPFLLVVTDQAPSITDLARQAVSFPWVVSLSFTCAYLVSTFIYFKNRWSLMGDANRL